MLVNYNIYKELLTELSVKKTLINTINAHSYNVTLHDPAFAEVLQNSDVLLPDGVSVVLAIRLLTGKKIQKIAGADLFFYEMERLEKINGTCFFLGSSNETLAKIKERATLEYPNVQIKTFSPPYKSEFSSEENTKMIDSINAFKPDVLFVGMTAPKQEKWAYQHFNLIDAGHVCSIGAVFDFYAGTVKRAPKWMINAGFEWLYRLLKEPKRMWHRYLIGNTMFCFYVLKEKLQQITSN